MLRQSRSFVTLLSLAFALVAVPALAADGTALELPEDGKKVLAGGLTTDLNQPPVANDDYFSTLWETPIDIPYSSLLANDSDPDGDPISVCQVFGPKHGKLAPSLTGVQYIPPDGCSFQSDTFKYAACDTSDARDTATVTIYIGGIICPDDNEQ